jgi:hypothetical protein
VTTTSARTEAPRTNEQRPAGQERDGSDSPHLDRGLESRARAFVAARRRATALLFVVAVVFVVVTVVGAKGTLLGYVQAGAEAAMIGGIARRYGALPASPGTPDTPYGTDCRAQGPVRRNLGTVLSGELLER